MFTQKIYGNSFPLQLIAERNRKNYMSLFDCIIMLVVDALLYFLLTLYFEYGRSKSLQFLLNSINWKRQYSFKKLGADNVLFERNHDIEMNDEGEVENVPHHFKEALRQDK